MTQQEIWRIRKRIQRAVEVDRDSSCAICGRRKGHRKNFLHRHHIVPVVELSVEAAMRACNIITVCESCHVELHKAAGTVTWSMAD
jgi:predicted HNH restriction endonuclease